MQDEEIDQVPPPAVNRRIGSAHLPHTGRKHTLAVGTSSAQSLRRLERHDERVIRTGANSMGGGEAEMDAVIRPRVADRFPAVLDLAITKCHVRLIMAVGSVDEPLDQ